MGLVLATAVGCAEPFPVSGVLRDNRVLALRVEVIEEGPLSAGLLPIPADRVRNSPLPLDTVVIRPLIAGPAGVRDPADFELSWLYCTAGSGSCFGTDGSALQRCTTTGTQPPCRFGDGAAEPTLTFPEIDTSVSALQELIQQTRPNIMLVGADPALTDTAHCERLLSGRPNEAFDVEGCLLGHVPAPLGPLGPLVAAARDAVPALGGDLLADPAVASAWQPGFHPELSQLTITIESEHQNDTMVLGAGTITRIPPDATMTVVEALDPRDNQRRVATLGASDDDIRVSTRNETHGLSLFTPAGEVILSPRTMMTGAPGNAFELIAITSDQGSLAWATFSFETEPE